MKSDDKSIVHRPEIIDAEFEESPRRTPNVSQFESGGVAPVRRVGSATGLASPVVMFLSAAIFAYFGFFIGLTPYTGSGEFVLFFAILLWTLRIGAVAFGVAGLLTMASPVAGNIVYALGSAATALGLLAVGIMDVMDDQRAAAIPPILAFIFAAWNGYGAYTGAMEILAGRGNRRDAAA